MVVFLKLAIALVCFGGYLTVASSKRVQGLSERRFHILIAALWLMTRVGLYCTVFLIFKMNVGSDVTGFYFPEGQHAMRGQIVYRDFASSYSPVFPYLIALILSVWNSAKAIVLASIFIEGLSLVVWLRVGRALWPEREYRIQALLYVLSAFAILDVAVAGQNQAWVALLLGTTVLFYQRRNTWAAAVVAGLPIILIKFLPLLYVPAFLRRGSKPVQMAVASLLFPVALVCVLLAKGIDAIQPIRLQASLITSGNLPYLASFLVSLDSGTAGLLAQFAALLILGAVSVYLFTRPGKLSAREIVFSIVILALTCALTNKKFFSTYLMMAFAPLCAVVAADQSRMWSAVHFGVFNVVASLEPSLWFRLMHATERHSNLFQLLPPLRDGGELWNFYMFLGVELLLLTCYSYYLVKAWTLLRNDLVTASDPASKVENIPSDQALVQSHVG